MKLFTLQKMNIKQVKSGEDGLWHQEEHIEFMGAWLAVENIIKEINQLYNSFLTDPDFSDAVLEVGIDGYPVLKTIHVSRDKVVWMVIPIRTKD